MAGYREPGRPAPRSGVAAPSRPRSGSAEPARSRGQAPVAMQAQPAVGVFTNKTVTITVAVSFALMAALAAIVVLSSLFVIPPQAAVVLPTPTSLPTATPQPFDPSVGAPLPNNRIVAFYGIAESGHPTNGYPSVHPFTFLPLLKQAGAKYTAADPKHPVQLGLDIVVNVSDLCIGYNFATGTCAVQACQFATCSHDVFATWIQAYIDYCQANHLLLFLDLQFGWWNVRDLVSRYLPYLQRYPFVELAIDTEFHFQPHQGFPDRDVGSVDASDLNWVIDQVAQIPMKYHVPRKVLMIHQFRPEVITHKNLIKTNPLVSIVVHVDGFGSYADKKGTYIQFVQQQLVQYGGFKLFDQHPEGGQVDSPLWTPQDVLSLTPAPLMITIQ